MRLATPLENFCLETPNYHDKSTLEQPDNGVTYLQKKRAIQAIKGVQYETNDDHDIPHGTEQSIIFSVQDRTRS